MSPKNIKGELMPKGLITSIISNTYEVEDMQTGSIVKCVPRGKLKNSDISISVGDKVDYELQTESEGVINEIVDRINFIKRPKMANITQMIFVVSMKMPKPDLLLLDKQLAFAEFNGIKTIICLNKIDLVDKKEIKEIEKTYKKIGYKVILTNAKTGEGLKDIQKCLKNNVTAFSGNSGVGKSTLINNLFENTLTLEGQISQRNQRGKNTTTSTKLYKIDNNSYIADTPGFSTFEINEIESKDLGDYFVDMCDFIKHCEFVGCTHIKEQECGIKHAVEKGKIDTKRYESYCKIYSELKEKEQHKW